MKKPKKWKLIPSLKEDPFYPDIPFDNDSSRITKNTSAKIRNEILFSLEESLIEDLETSMQDAAELRGAF